MSTPSWLPTPSQQANDPLADVYQEPITITAVASATGVATATFQPVPASYRWLIDYIVVSSDSAATSGCNVYDSQVDNAHLLDGTSTLGNNGVAAYQPARVLGSSHSLIVVWTGATSGAKCNVRVEYRRQKEG